MARLTIGLPVTNEEPYYTDAIKSIFAQSYSDWELIIICNGSHPRIVNRLRKIADERVRVVVNDYRRVLSLSLNDIATLSQSEYIARMDADDIMMPSRLEIQMNYLRENPNVDVLGTGSYLINECRTLRGSYREPDLVNMEGPNFIKSGILCHPSIIARRTWFVDNPYDPSWVRTEDKELWLRTYRFSNFAKVPNKVMAIRVPETLSIEKIRLTHLYNRKLTAIYVVKLNLPKVSQLMVLGKLQIRYLILLVLIKTRLHRIAYRSKYKKLSKNEKAEFNLQFEKVMSTDVPGWD